MFQKILHFIKYNNAAVIILAIILILGGGALAAGPEAIGEKQTSIEGLDNTALLSVDLNAFNMDFKIENIQQDEKYYYVTYSFLDLAVINQVWQYQLSQKTQKVSKKIKEDIGVYTAKFLAKHYEARMRELKQEKSRAEALGEQTRVEVTEYSGLIGKTLDLAAKVFPGYEPVVKRELPTPLFVIPAFFSVIPAQAGIQGLNSSSPADNLTQIYNDYLAAHPDIFNTPTEPTPTDTASSSPDTASSSPDSAGSPQADSAGSPQADSAGSPQADSTVPGDTAAAETPVTTETPAIPEPTSVEIIELPAPVVEPAPAAPAAEAAPTPAPETAPAQ